MAEWWFLQAGEPVGPVSDDDLVARALNGGLSPASPVFRAGSVDWTVLAHHEQGLGLVRNAWGTYFVATPALAPHAGGMLTSGAAPWPRVKAYLIDNAVLNMLGAAAAFMAVPMLGRARSGSSMLVLLIGLTLITGVLCLAYEVLLTAVRGQTVGKLRCDIEIAVADSAELPDLSRSLLRALVKSVTCSGIVAPVTLLVWLLTPERVTLHDWVAGTRVQNVT